jgi:hypothetical protein
MSGQYAWNLSMTSNTINKIKIIENTTWLQKMKAEMPQTNYSR